MKQMSEIVTKNGTEKVNKNKTSMRNDEGNYISSVSFIVKQCISVIE